MEGNALSSTENFFQSNLLLLENTSKQRIQTVFPSANRILNTRKTIVFIELAVKENCWIMKRTLEFADSKATGKRWIFLSENVRKMLEKFAFSNIQNLFSEPVNTICFAIKHEWSNEINKYFKIYVEITVLYTTEMLLILQGKRRSIIPKFIIIIHGKCIRRKMIPNSW